MARVPAKNQELAKLIFRQKKLYAKIGIVKCPILGNREVHFTMQGFRHLHIEGNNHPRGSKDATMRLNLLPEAVAVVSRSRMIKRTTLEPANETSIGKRVIHHEIFCRVGTSQVGVIVVVKQVGNGNLFFYGIRPAKKKNRPQK